MGVKLYIAGLVFILTRAHKYATRYQQQLQGNLTTEQYACLVSFIAVLADCITVITAPPMNP